MHGSRWRRGYSLLEVMFVLAIVGILLALGIGRYRTMQENAALSASAEDLAGALALARQEAIGYGSAPVFSGQGLNRAQPLTARYVWRVEKNGVAVAEGRIAEGRQIFLDAPGNFSRKTQTSGTCLAIYKVNEQGTRAGTPDCCIMFGPDGSPVDTGSGQRDFSLAISNTRVSHRIDVSSMGSIDGPKAGGPLF